MMIVGLDHIQMALPAGAEEVMRKFYCESLGMREVAKPEPLRGRGGFWAVAGTAQVHFGVDPDFHPAKKAHPAFIIDDLNALAERLKVHGHPVTWDTSLPTVTRCFTADPVGNRIELIAAT
ncbi:VOC family protein [Yoonia litorea]|uniref:VOC domain-containing protein n=1 Tax=Yoonia litorea TaxID=1123755 RepID=A0A1I6MZF0_9RHOB|nr:VOC family protein [Yoonia litorea]SFS20981.1 hypothetical protein SAMN05444714_2701 [Yoonia litorea]